MKNVSWQPVGLCVAAFFLHGCGSDDADSSFTVSPSNLERIQLSVLNEPTGVISASSVLPIGSHLQYQATAIYNDGSPQQDVTDSVLWNSESSEVAGIDSHGIVTAQAEGDTRISASLNGVTSSTLPLHTSSATLTSLSIEGKSVALIDLPVELKAIAVYSDHTQQDVSDFATWESTTEDVMDIDKGYVTPSSSGRFEVMASYRGLSNERSETIIDSSDITDITLDIVNLNTDTPLGSTVQLASVLNIETEEDTVKFIMENHVDYESDNAAISISDSGLLSADAIAENVTISASTTLYDTTVTDTQVVNVVGSELAPLTLSCDEDTIYLGLLANCKATAHHLFLDTRDIVNEDVTALATWSVSNEEVLSLEDTGQVKGRAVGTSSVQVEYYGQTRSQEIQVLGGGVASIDVQSGSDFIPDNSELPMRAIATMVNDETQDVTPLVNWQVSSEEFATINSEGTLTALEVEDSEVVTVTAATIDINGTPISDTKDITITGAELPICGGAIDNTDQTNATDACLKIATDGEGNWFTNTPSIAVMNALGYSVDNSATNSGDTYASLRTESSHGPVDGQFAQFRQDGVDDDGVQVVEPGDDDDANAGVNGQFDRWCKKLNAFKFGGRTTWTRPTDSELSAFYQKYDDERLELGLWSARGWPTGIFYGSSTVDEYALYRVRLLTNGIVGGVAPSDSVYASCVSKNP